jgi:acyl-CoA synthetase (AMP-forming)/AMP-acid ligase II
MTTSTSGHAVPERTMHGVIVAHARRAPDAPAVLEPGFTPLSYARVVDHFEAMVSGLRALGVGRGDRVALLLGNGAMMATALMAITAGATCVPLHPQLSTPEVERLFAGQRIRALVTDPKLASSALDVARRLQIPIVEVSAASTGEAGAFTLSSATGARVASLDAEPEDLAVVLTTSGTTAEPKAVRYTHRDLVYFVQDIAERLQLGPGDRCLNVMPLFHSHGLFVALLASLAAGGSVICTRGLFFVPDFFRWLKEEQPTWYTAVPTVQKSILAKAGEHRDEIASCKLRLVRAASASLSSEVATELERTFNAPVIETYGLTEILGWLAHTPLPPRVRKPGSVGIAGGHVIGILSPDGSLLPRGQTGELAIRGRDRVIAYEKDGVIEPIPLVDGWFRTGDQAYEDSDGYFFITGRTKEMINRGGEKISPSEVERILKEHAGIAEAVVFPVPSPSIGEEVGCALIVRPGVVLTSEDVRSFVAGKLAPYKIPRMIAFTADIPKGPTGKYQRLTLAADLGMLGAGARP